MDQSSKFQNKINGNEICENFMNDIITKEISKNNPNLQTTLNAN